MQGFTIVEVIIVLGIFGLILLVSLPVGIDAYRNYLLTSETRNFVGILRRAENFALSNKKEGNYGVYLDEDEFILFKGASFASREEMFDEKYPREASVSVSGLSEVVFSQVSGNPVATATITLSNDLTFQTIDINEEGTIFW